MTHRLIVIAVVLLAMLGGLCPTVADEEGPAIGFPERRPRSGSFVRPREGSVLGVTPPGFCWWRAASLGTVRYRLRIVGESEQPSYESALLEAPVCVPERVLPAGEYRWTVEAIDEEGKVADIWGPMTFTIAEGAYAQPWTPVDQLLAQVPDTHPRLLFPRACLPKIRATLDTSRAEAFDSLRRRAEGGLALDVPPEPDYDEIKDPAQRRLAYVRSFQEMRRYHTGGMLHLALMYVMSGERQYGLKAKALLLGAAEWDPEGISSVMGRYGDEVGLGLAKSAALTYDWIYDLLDEKERLQVEAMLVARADQMLRRLQRRDFLARPGSSHDGRLPGYLIEHAIALADKPRAKVWMDYALRTVMTVFPHWAGQDGGWAEGLAYGSAYNTIFITPLESLRTATGLDIWQRPFYREVPYFFLYNTSPVGEIFGFGDSYDFPVARRTTGLRSLMQFYAERFDDPGLRWWVDLLEREDGRRPGLSALPGIVLPQTVQPAPPEDLPSDAVFRGVGWAALHTDLGQPHNDLMVMFKSSPFGPVSHSYADQNSFAILRGGKALARPGGSRYPQHGTPFHTKYTQQTVAQNSILVDGQGQLNRRADANGQIVAFRSTPWFGYVCGDATAAYGDCLNRFQRHVLLIRPSLVCIVDDLVAPQSSQFQWLMHAAERLELDEETQTLVSRRGPASMTVRLVTPGDFLFTQTDAWPLDPKTGFPTASRPLPTTLWHFTAETRQRTPRRRIAAVMVVRENDEDPQYEIVARSKSTMEVRTETIGGDAVVKVHLDAEADPALPVMELRYEPEQGEPRQVELSSRMDQTVPRRSP